MERKQIVANVCVGSIGIIFVLVMLWFRPDLMIEMLTPVSLALVVVLLIMWRARIDDRKDERSMQLMILGGRNAFIFLLLVMPMLATFSFTGIILIDAYGALMLLWTIALVISWISFLYYYTR